MRSNVTLSVGLRYDWQNYFHDNNDVAPRASIAFSPTESGRTVIRSGIGIDPGYPIPGVALAAEPASIVRFGQDIVILSWLQYGVSAERQLRKGTSASEHHVHGDGRAPSVPVA